MRSGSKITVIIPALNEEAGIQKVLPAIPNWVDGVVVVDNGSIDGTRDRAEALGARIVVEPRRGYGSACLAGIASLESTEIVVFLDADFSDRAEEMDRLVDPILRDEADMVIGSRVRGRREKGALTPQARIGNWIACRIMRLFWGVAYTDLGPFRAIRHSALRRLEMQDKDYGWTVEMQVKAAICGLRSAEVPVSYRRRTGRSKVSGTVKGVVMAGYKILFTLFKFGLRRRVRQERW